MAAGKVEAAAGRMPSIELEPKTLTLDQLKYAREAALNVVSTKTAEEAIRIFTDGLKPVPGVRNSSSAAVAESSSDDDLDIGCFNSSGNKACCRHHHLRGRRCSSAVARDIATAPF